MDISDRVATEFHRLVGLTCALYAQAGDGCLEDILALCERSSTLSPKRDRVLAQQRDPREREKTRRNAIALISPLVPQFELYLKRVDRFKAVRDKYAHAYPVSVFGQAHVQHPPHMKHSEAGLCVPMESVFAEINMEIVDFLPISDSLRRLKRDIQPLLGDGPSLRFDPNESLTNLESELKP